MGRRLGQHFLRDEKILRQIADLLEINSSDVVIEIGPGHGELTFEIKNQISKIKNNLAKIIAIEKDEELAKNLEFRIHNSELKNVEIIHGDALKILPSIPKSHVPNSKSYKLVGNIPYYITGYLFRVISELEHKPEIIVFTIQKEVAERICAKPPEMNLLAASVQFWATPTVAGVVSKKSFNPQPKVDSAVIKLLPKTVDKKLVKRYYELVKIVFKQPRKTILNNLAAGLKLPKEEIIETLTKQGIKPNARPQDLSIKALLNLSEFHRNVFRAKK